MRRLIPLAAALAVLLACAPPARAEEWTTAARIERWFETLEPGGDPTDELVALARLRAHQEHGEVAARLDALAERRLARRDTDPALAARLHEWLGTRADRRGEPAAAAEHFRAAGYLPDWSTMGPFPSYGGGGMDTPLGPELPGCAEGCVHDGREMGWVPRAGFGAHGHLDLSQCHEERRDVLAYLRTYVHVERPTPVALRAGGGDGLQVSVAGRVVIDDPTYRTATPDQVATGVMLAPGWSELRLKVGQETGAWGCYLRLTAPDGGPLPGLTAALAPPDGAPRAAALDDPVEVADPLAAAFAAGLEPDAGAETLRRAAELAHVTAVADRRDDRTVGLVRRAVEAGAAAGDGGTIELRLLLAELGEEPEERLAVLDGVLAEAPDCHAARYLRYQYAQAHLDRRRDLALLREAAADPGELAAGRDLVDELAALGATEAALERLAELERVHPASPTLRNRRAQLWLDLGNRARALQAYDESLALAALSTTRARRMGIRREMGDWRGALDDARALAEAHPHAQARQRALARELERSGDLEGAVAHLRAVADRFPDAASLHRELGELLHRLDDAEGARDAWERSLALQPRNPMLEEYIAFLEGTEDPLRQRWRRDPLTLPTGDDPALYEGTPARVLLLSRALQVAPDGTDQEYVQQVIQLDSELGARAFQTIPLAYDRDRERLRVITAEVIHPDGSRSKARSIRDRSDVSQSAGAYYHVYTKEIAFDELWPGDRVHVEYKRESREKRNRFRDFFGVLVPVQSWVPTVDAAVRIEVPAEMALYTGQWGLPAPEIVDEREARLYHFSARDLPAVPQESNGPGYYELGAYLSATNFESWDRVAAWWMDLSRDQFRLGEDGKARAAELAAAAGDDREARVRAIYEYVVRNTHYVGLEFGIHGWKPYESQLVLDRGYGDCKDQATLLVALLGEVGIEAEVVLLQTVINGRAADHPANLHLFNHAIAYVPELDLYLDATAEYAPLEALRWDDQGALGLRVARDGSGTLVELPLSAAEDNLTTSDTTVELDAAGTATFHEHWTERGLLVGDLRRAFHDDSTRRQDLEENYQGRLTGVRLTDVQTEGFDDLENRLVFDVYGEIPAFARTDGTTMAVPVTLFPDQLGPLMAPEGARRTDVVLRLPHAVEISTRITPPEGYAFGPPPEPVALDTGHTAYEQSVTLQDGIAVVRMRLEYRDRRIPAADYPAFREFCLGVDRAQKQILTLTRDGGAP